MTEKEKKEEQECQCEHCKEHRAEQLCRCPWCKGKKIFHSRNFWAALALIGCSVFILFGDLPFIKENKDLSAYLGFGFGILWIVLRFVTDKPIIVKSPNDKLRDM